MLLRPPAEPPLAPVSSAAPGAVLLVEEDDVVPVESTGCEVVTVTTSVLEGFDLFGVMTEVLMIVDSCG